MKIILLQVVCTLSMLVCISTKTNAQLVHIPDSAFRAYLNQHATLAPCMVGDSIDSNCPAVLNTTVLTVINQGISNLSGIEVFVNDTLLYCHDNLLTSLPALPPTLKQLRCWSNQLTALPALPSTLSQLICFNNQLTSLPTLPPSLITLQCQGNQLSSLPVLPNSITTLSCSFNQLNALPSLPNSLIYFGCGDNQLTTLPPLPSGIISLSCSDNQINTLPTLPAALNYLSCEDNQLTSIPNLPSALIDLTCRNNLITSLPPLPQSLVYLNCSTNQLTSLPNLPALLTNLSCSANQLTSLPALPAMLKYIYCLTNQLNSLPFLPDSLLELVCSDNQISTLPMLPSSLSKLWCDDNPIACLPKLNNVTNLRFNNTQITCLPTYGILQSSIPPFSGYPTCDIYNTNGCEVFWNIEGTTFVDGNTNCIKDSGEVPFRNQKISLYKNSILDQQTYTNINGDYDFDISSFDNYFTVFSTSVIPFNVNCPLSGIYMDTISVTDSMKYDRDFALSCDGVDLAVTSIFSPPLRAASIREVKIQAGDYANFFGVQCAQGINGTVVITLNGPCQFHSPAPNALVPSSVAGNIVTYTISDFGLVNYDGSFNFNILVDTTATLGSQIQIQVTISTGFPETNYYNNLLSQSFTVEGSYDPNDKSVYPDSTLDISGDRWLTYTIRFQNTGTASAEHIYITDTLSNKLDRSTFTILSYSHEPLTLIFPSGLIKFNFPFINLPDSNSNEPDSHGYVQFKIKANPSLLAGTIIENTANIFFDFNAPVITNTTSNIVINCALPPTLIQSTICENQPYILNGIQYSTPGTFTQKYLTALGCDSNVILNLNVIPANNYTSASICPGIQYNFNGQLLSTPGIYIDTLIGAYGCDSIIELNLSINSIYFSQQTETICENDSLYFGGGYILQPGIYIDTLLTISGCDSIIEMQINQTIFNNVISQIGNTLQTTQTGTTYRWINCLTNNPMVGATNQTYTPFQSGTFAVVVSDGFCKDTSNCISVSTTGINELNAGVLLQCNFASDNNIIRVSIDGLPHGGTLTLTDLRGRTLNTTTLPSDGNLQRRIDVPASNLASGMYLIHLTGEKVALSGKVVK